MNLYGELIERNLREMERGLDSPTFTLGAGDTEYVCVPSSVEAGTVLEIGGMATEILFSLITRKVNFLNVDGTYALPAAGQLVTFREGEYRILAVKEDLSGVFLKLHLADPASGRK